MERYLANEIQYFEVLYDEGHTIMETQSYV